MRAVILNPGPSLARVTTADVEGAELVIGVNRAAIIAHLAGICSPNVWAFTDWKFLVDLALVEEIPNWPCDWLASEAILNVGSDKRRIVLDHLDIHRRHGQVTYYRDLYDFCPRKTIGWTLFTATAALVYAASCGATVIDVYGADWTPGGADADGVNLVGNNRDAERWGRERILWDRLTAWLGERGVTVSRRFS